MRPSLCFMETAPKDSWKRKPLPEQREALHFISFYTDERAERIIHGYRPRDMDDKWFIYAEKGWVYFHRSWTGDCIFAMKLDGSPAGVRVTESWVNRDTRQYTCKSIEQDRELLKNLIAHYFPDQT